MRFMKTVLTLAFVATVAIAVVPTFAAEEAAVDVVLSGEPVDITCYMSGKSGEGHAGCATACANKGNPIGLVVDEGDKKVLYLVLGADGKASKELMAEYMGYVVDVTGKASKKDGLNIIVASSVAEGADEEEWFPEEVVGGASVIVD